MAQQRAMAAKRRELAAHERAVVLHEQAATLQHRLGYEAKAQTARERAGHARDLHDLALVELADWASWAAAGTGSKKVAGEVGPA